MSLGSLSTEVFFIIDGDWLEAQACLLAPTLKRNLMPGQIGVAYLRQDYLHRLHPFTRAVLDASKVELRTIPETDGTHAPWAKPYPHGNKILAAAQPRDCDISVFLDTDTILVERVNFAEKLGDALIAACVSDYASAAGSDADWTAYYAAFGMEPTQDRVQYNGGRQLVSYPYFNAGVILFREREADGTPTHLGRDWLSVALRFEREVTREYPRANIDQFTLPILGYLRGIPVQSLDQEMNFNVQAFGQGEKQRQSIAHYHRLGILWSHDRHGRMALEALIGVMGPDAVETYLDTFGALAKRKRMKRHIAAVAETSAAARPFGASRARTDP